MVLVKYWTLRWESGARGGRGQSQQTSLQNLSVYVIILGWGWRLASRPRVVLPPHDRELAAMVGVVLLERSLHFSEETPIERILPSPYSCPACISLHLAHRGMRCDHNLSSGFIKKKKWTFKKIENSFHFFGQLTSGENRNYIELNFSAIGWHPSACGCLACKSIFFLYQRFS